MNVQLSTYGRSFATRERATELLPSLVKGDGDLSLDVSGVMWSTSFLSELLSGLAKSGRAVRIILSGDPALADRATWVRDRMGLDAIKIEQGPASAAPA